MDGHWTDGMPAVDLVLERPLLHEKLGGSEIVGSEHKPVEAVVVEMRLEAWC
jgi:hypothetical protein